MQTDPNDLFTFQEPNTAWKEKYIARKRYCAAQIIPNSSVIHRIGFRCSTRNLHMTTARTSTKNWLRLGLDFEHLVHRALIDLGFKSGTDLLHPASIPNSRRRPDFALTNAGILLEAKIIPEAMLHSPDQILDYTSTGRPVVVVCMTDSDIRWHDPSLTILSLDLLVEHIPNERAEWYTKRARSIANLVPLDDIDLFKEGQALEKDDDPRGALEHYEKAISRGSRHPRTFERASILIARSGDVEGHRWIRLRTQHQLSEAERVTIAIETRHRKLEARAGQK